jgi:hypothetical protein
MESQQVMGPYFAEVLGAESGDWSKADSIGKAFRLSAKMGKAVVPANPKLILRFS